MQVCKQVLRTGTNILVLCSSTALLSNGLFVHSIYWTEFATYIHTYLHMLVSTWDEELILRLLKWNSPLPSVLSPHPRHSVDFNLSLVRIPLIRELPPLLRYGISKKEIAINKQWCQIKWTYLKHSENAKQIVWLESRGDGAQRWHGGIYDTLLLIW